MPVYFKVREDQAAGGNPPPPEVVNQPPNNPNHIQKANNNIANYLVANNQGLTVDHGNLPAVSFANLAQLQAHNFATVLAMNGGVDVDNQLYGNYLNLFDEVFVGATYFDQGWGCLEPDVTMFGESYRRIVAELAGTSMCIAIGRRVVGNVLNGNAQSILMDYNQFGAYFNVQQQNNRADYVWIVPGVDNNGNAVMNDVLVTEAKGSLGGFQQATLDRAAQQTFDTVGAINNALGMATSGVSTSLYTIAGANQENVWEIALIDPTTDGTPKQIDWDTYFQFVRAKLDYFADPEALVEDTSRYIANGGSEIEVVTKIAATGHALYEACIPVEVYDALGSMSKNRGQDLYKAIEKYCSKDVLNVDSYGDRWFGEYFAPGLGLFVKVLPVNVQNVEWV